MAERCLLIGDRDRDERKLCLSSRLPGLQSEPLGDSYAQSRTLLDSSQEALRRKLAKNRGKAEQNDRIWTQDGIHHNLPVRVLRAHNGDYVALEMMRIGREAPA